jgi:hypothetical protein
MVGARDVRRPSPWVITAFMIGFAIGGLIPVVWLTQNCQDVSGIVHSLYAVGGQPDPGGQFMVCRW